MKSMSLRDRIDAFCALIGIWAAAILKYFDDLEASGLAEYSDLLELLEIAEMSEVLAGPLLAIGLAGTSRVFCTAYHNTPARRAIARREPPRRDITRHF
jgi:hypothetical protein